MGMALRLLESKKGHGADRAGPADSSVRPAAWRPRAPSCDTARVGADEGYFGELVADTYDAHSASMFDPAVVGPAADTLAALTGDGRALEFAIGTGRIALPLAERGVPV